MGFIELFFIAVGLSMDAFAVAISIGLSLKKASLKNALIVGWYFGLFQALMPLIGYLAASLFAEKVAAFSGWVAFVLLGIIGARMIFESLKKEKDCDKTDPDDGKTSLGPARLLPLALATSIDALAAGVSFAFLQVAITPAVILIGIVTCVFSVLGVKIGSVFGARFKAKAEFAGGVILIVLGLKILLERLSVLHF